MSENNRYFHPEIPLVAPEKGYQILQKASVFCESREQSVQLTGMKGESPFTGKSVSRICGSRQFAYHVMALMVKKFHGDTKAAMEEMLVADHETEFEPFIVPNPEGEGHICLGKPTGNRGFGIQAEKKYDPSKKESIADQLSVGKAADAGDVFEWRSNIRY